jgi:uncharacterized protein YndB with AHSA1/START domain
MSKRSTHHDTFVIERTFDASPARVYKAFSDPAAKSKWFGSPNDWTSGVYSFDFKIGGHEKTSGGPAGGPVHYYDATFQDIVPNERIVTTYVMHLDDAQISVSLGTTEIAPDGKGTRMTYTEQGVYLDGYDNAGQREHGTKALFDNLAASLAREDAAT